MIYLTADVHQRNLGNNESKLLSKTPMELARTYSEICTKYKIKHTIYIVAIALSENKTITKYLMDNEYVNLGVHTYSAFRIPFFRNRIIHKLYRRAYKYWIIQKMDIKLATQIFKQYGIKASHWRTHAYASNKHTEKLLKEMGYKTISDVKKRDGEIKLTNGLLNYPINVISDHEYLVHGSNANTDLNDPFFSKRLEAKEWLKEILWQINQNERNGKSSTILIHPECMEILDKFKTFEAFCKEISNLENGHIGELNE
jgi:hypothetical protein